MDVLFATRAIEKKLGTDASRRKAFGDETARAIARRLQQMQSAPSLEDLRNMPGRYHELTGDRHCQVSVSVGANLRLVFECADEPLPCRQDGGGLDWSGVTKVRLLEVVDYHG